MKCAEKYPTSCNCIKIDTLCTFGPDHSGKFILDQKMSDVQAQNYCNPNFCICTSHDNYHEIVATRIANARDKTIKPATTSTDEFTGDEELSEDVPNKSNPISGEIDYEPVEDQNQWEDTTQPVYEEEVIPVETDIALEEEEPPLVDEGVPEEADLEAQEVVNTEPEEVQNDESDSNAILFLAMTCVSVAFSCLAILAIVIAIVWYKNKELDYKRE